MSAGHTPGPWVVAYKDKNGQSVVKGEHIEVATCWHHSVGEIEKEMHANARLIAAAPELLEALVTAIDCLNKLSCNHKFSPDCDVCEAEQLARAAIAKATGETKWTSKP